MPLRPDQGHPPAPYPKLAPFLVGRARRGVVGSSRYACRLREQIRQAAADPARQAVLVSGEPGLEKDNIAALIHFGSPCRRQLLARLAGAGLRGDGANLFGSSGTDGTGSLLDRLGAGSLLIDQVDQVPAALLPALTELAATGRWRAPGGEGPWRQFNGRLLFTAECAQPQLDRVCQVIRVPPLRVRRQDLGEWLRYSVRLRSPGLGWADAPGVSEAVVKRLQAYDFPSNLRELDALVVRALQQARRQGGAAALGQTLPEDVFWTPSRPSRLRFDLWRWKPGLRTLMRSPRFWNTLLFGLVSWVFVLVNLWLWLGPQDRQHNGALNLFWAWWWPLILLGYPLVGRLWCSFCPFMVWGEISQRLARRLGWEPRPWPRGDTDRWAAPLLAVGFAAILIWEELGNLENTAWLSSALLLLITAGAVLGSLLFEKRFWCRYLCPVGGMNGLFAKLSLLELRAQAGTCSGSCSSYACFKGGPAEGEGLATEGCPLGTHPAHLSDNRNCVLCLTCAQACPHRSVQLRLRPPAADLQRAMDPPAGEAALILVLAGGVCLHHWQRLLGWLPWVPASLHSGELLPRLAVACLALALPALLLCPLGLVLSRERRRLVPYALLPLLWGLLLARHLPHGLLEAGRLLPVTAAGLGAWPTGVQVWAAGLPQWHADPHVLAFCQSLCVLVGALGCLPLLVRLLQPGRLGLVLAGSGVLLLAASGRWLVAL